VAAVGDHRRWHELPERTRLALEWADIVLGGGHGAGDDLRRRLLDEFTPAEVVELTYAIGTFIGYSKQIITLGMEPEHLDVTVVPTPGA
jgi:alkylhydroperoxidase family enzyme